MPTMGEANARHYAFDLTIRIRSVALEIIGTRVTEYKSQGDAKGNGSCWEPLEPWGRMTVEYEGFDEELPWIQRQARTLSIFTRGFSRRRRCRTRLPVTTPRAARSRGRHLHAVVDGR